MIARALTVVLLLAACSSEQDGDDGREPALSEGRDAAPGGLEAGAQATPRSDASGDRAIEYPDTTGGLHQLVTHIAAAIDRGDRRRAVALVDSLRLPDPGGWFARVFGRRLGVELAREYADLADDIRELVPLLRSLTGSGNTEILVERFAEPASSAVGYQKRALERMVNRVPLYSVRLVEPGSQRGFHLWSFVHDGASFRWVGKMKRVAPEDAAERAAPPVPLDGGVPDLLELRARDRQASAP